MCLQVTLTFQCVCPMLGLLFWWHVFLSVGIHIRLCLLCMKNKMAKLCGYILKLKLFGKPSNWCFHYLMIHLDKTPNKPSETWLRVAICSDVIFLIGEEQAPVLIWISCMNPYILPVKPSQTDCYMALSCDLSTVNSTVCAAWMKVFSPFFSLFFCNAGMWLAFQPRKHEGTRCPFSYGTSSGLSLQ